MMSSHTFTLNFSTSKKERGASPAASRSARSKRDLIFDLFKHLLPDAFDLHDLFQRLKRLDAAIIDDPLRDGHADPIQFIQLLKRGAVERDPLFLPFLWHDEHALVRKRLCQRNG